MSACVADHMGQALDLLCRALHQLPEEYQIILLLRFGERKNHKEAAVLINRTVATVKNTQHRALIRLTELLGFDQKARHYLRGNHE